LARNDDRTGDVLISLPPFDDNREAPRCRVFRGDPGGWSRAATSIAGVGMLSLIGGRDENELVSDPARSWRRISPLAEVAIVRCTGGTRPGGCARSVVSSARLSLCRLIEPSLLTRASEIIVRT
jgi:hypothetical protein